MFAGEYSFGILRSDLHWLWFTTKCSKLKSDFRYTPESVFDTFPWPQVAAAPEAQRRLAGGTAPGVPLGFPKPETLVTDDCIEPPDTGRRGIPHPDSTPQSEADAAHYYRVKEERPASG